MTSEKHHPCGCVNVWDETWDMWAAVRKCGAHAEAAQRDAGLGYYRHLGCFTDTGAIAPVYAREMDEALEAMGAPPIRGRASGTSTAAEVGGGPGVYLAWLLDRGFLPMLVEPDDEACEYARLHQPRAGVFEGTWEECCADGKNWGGGVDLIVAAHVAEHMREGPVVFRSFHDNLQPGGALLTIVPDDEDLLNPGHWWFYSPAALAAALAKAGFTDVKLWTARRIPRERFIYSYARRPV